MGWPSWLYQRHSEFWQRGLLAAGWALLFVLCDTGIANVATPGGFGLEWRIVLAACIWVGGVCKPPVAYALLVAAIAYPLYQVSIYVMALALAALILAAPAVVRFLPPALWVLIAPLWAPVSLIPLAPLLAGLWWGETTGAVAGALAALWLKIGAAMTGAAPGLWQINGWALTMPPIYAHFHGVDSLQTLLRIVDPLASSSLTLLFHLLQLLSWAAAGFAVGFLARRLRVRQPWAAALSLGVGLVLIWAGYVAVPVWLGLAGPTWRDPLWLPAQVLLAGAVAWTIAAAGRYLNRPLLDVKPAAGAAQKNKPAWWPRRRRKVTAQTLAEQPEPGEGKPRRKSKSRDDQDIIMLELD